MDALVVVVGIAMAVAAVGTLVPMVPGLGLAWVAALAYGLGDGFGAPGVTAMAVITALAAGGAAAGWVVPARVAGRAGAARQSLVLGAVGAVIGFFVIPVVGLIVGGVAGVYLGEWQRTSDGAAAWRATRATLTGFGVAAALQFAAVLLIAVTWAVWVVAG
jgi:uncharacterized protein YqgC (DUF456 family)